MTSHGHLDAITQSGFVEGWALDAALPWRSLAVAVQAGEDVVAHGVAHRYRWDLIGIHGSTGWNAFRLRLCRPAASLIDTPLTLLASESGDAILSRAPPLLEDAEAPLADLARLVAADPTLVHDIDHLRGCAPLFAGFIDAAGLEAFIAAAFVYVLGRPADPAGRAHYAACLRDASLAPFELLRTLHDSAEYRAAPRPLAAPTDPGFPFLMP
jgi:hypothetical protein